MTDILKLAESVKKMRDAQKEYFRTRSGISLSQAKKLESEVDKMIPDCIGPRPITQSNMFGKPMPATDPDLKHEIKFCLNQEMEINAHGKFVYISSNGADQQSVPHMLSEYRDFLIAQGIVKDYQRS